MIFDLKFYWKLLLYRFPVMALLFTLCTGLAAFTAVRLPEVFNTSARVLVEEPQIPESMVASTVRTDASEQLDIIQQRLLTRANLLDIANKFDVYEDIRQVPPDTIVSRMQQDTTVRRSARRDSATLMTIAFRGRNGEVVANVVNEYVTLVLESNMDFRMSRAENTLDFFEQEVDRLGAELDRQSLRIAEFKSSNAGALPENQSYRLGRQTLLQERLSRLERDMQTLSSQRDDIERIFEATGRVGQTSDTPMAMTAEQRQLLVAKTDLQQALLTYTPENPRVIRLQAIVDRLEAIIATQTSAQLEAIETGEVAMTPAEAMFQASMTDIDSRIETLRSDISATAQELATLEVSIAASSVNGVQLNDLERDFQRIQAQYNTAVANLNQAQMTERIETTAQGQRITVIEGANAPRLPSGPNRMRIVAFGAAVGLGLALGFFVLLELLNRTVRRPVELIHKYNVTPIATIPFMESRSHRTVRRLLLIFGSIIAVVGVPVGLYYIDTNYMPLDVLTQRVLARLGLM